MSNVKKEPTFLIVCFRLIGDVLVTTPIASSIRKTHPNATIDYLVFKGTEKAISKNPDINKVITISKDSSGIGTLLTLFRKYDIAIAAYPSDRTVLAAAMAGKCSFGLTYGRRNEWWKGLLLNYHQVAYDRLHVVAVMLSLVHTMAIKPIPTASMGYDQGDLQHAQSKIGDGQYILMHPYSMKRCKYWPAENWAKLASLIHSHTGCRAVFTATPSPEDNIFLKEILASAPAEALSYACDLNQFAAALKGCVAYIGIDTAATHIAAAMEIPTIALYGPSLTRYWAPWPNGCMEQSPFLANKGIQRNGYVSVIQKDWECVPCNRETCAISKRNKMECLEQITPAEVFKEVMESVNRYHQEQSI